MNLVTFVLPSPLLTFSLLSLPLPGEDLVPEPEDEAEKVPEAEPVERTGSVSHSSKNTAHGSSVWADQSPISSMGAAEAYECERTWPPGLLSTEAQTGHHTMCTVVAQQWAGYTTETFPGKRCFPLMHI